MTASNLPFFFKHTYDQLVAMGKIYYSGKANPYQTRKYEYIRDGLYAELKSVWPETPARFAENAAAYLHAAIDHILWEQRRAEKRIQAGMRANMQTAHDQLLNWK